MNNFKRLMLARPFSGNGLLTFFASIAFGSLAFATSNIEISQLSASEISASAIASVERLTPAADYVHIPSATDRPVIALLNLETTDELTLSTSASEVLQEPGRGSSTAADSPSTEQKVQQALVLVLLSVLAGDR